MCILMEELIFLLQFKYTWFVETYEWYWHPPYMNKTLKVFIQKCNNEPIRQSKISFTILQNLHSSKRWQTSYCFKQQSLNKVSIWSVPPDGIVYRSSLLAGLDLLWNLPQHRVIRNSLALCKHWLPGHCQNYGVLEHNTSKWEVFSGYTKALEYS